jgi:hypothetical protein
MRFSDHDYAELLGLYLGDGSISKAPRAHRLRIALDAKYPVVIEEGRQLLVRCFPENAVDVVTAGLKGNLVNLSVYSQHLTCLLPQHGPGRKHTRAIELEQWQRDRLDRAPWPFLKGCIRSDGCCFINRTDIHRPRPYEYLSYQFANRSKDIVDLFLGACERVGVDCRLNGPNKRGLWQVRINRRGSVALMLENVGRKS